jgi:hypothetical protein
MTRISLIDGERASASSVDEGLAAMLDGSRRVPNGIAVPDDDRQSQRLSVVSATS